MRFLLVVLFISLCSVHSLADDTDSRIAVIAKSLQRMSELSNEVQITGTLIGERAWPKKSGNEWKKTTEFSTRKWDIFFARSGDKLRCDLTENFPDKMTSSNTTNTNKYIMKQGQLINASGFEAANPHVFLEETQMPAFFSEIQMLLNSHYSLLFGSLAEELLQGENYTFQIIREEPCNGSECIVLHGKMTKTRLAKAMAKVNSRILLSDITVEVDLWLDKQKDFSIIQYKYHAKNLPYKNYIEKAIELGEVESEEYGTIWFPKKVVEENHIFPDGKKQLFRKSSLLVEKVTIAKKVEPSLFTLDGLGLLPGTKVIDKIKGIDYKWGEDVVPSTVGQQRIAEQRLEEAQEHAQHQLEEQQKPSIRLSRILILITLLLVVGLGLTIIWRNRRKKK